LFVDSGLDAVWVDSSPSGGDPVTRVDTGIAQYFGVGAYLRDLPDVRHSGVGFAAECLAFSHLPDPVVPGGVPGDNGADWDFADVREHYLRARYGDEATEADAQRVTGEVMAEVFGEWRRPGSVCGGGIVLWLRDLEPGAGWGLLDHQGRPKPAAHVLASVLQPTAVWFVDEGLNGLDVHVAHDRPDEVDLTLVVELLRADGSVLESAEQAWTMEPRGHRRWTVDALLGRFADSSYAYRFGPPPHAAVRARLTGAGVERETTWHVPAV
jgi:beta-mannosidase